jgi:3-dehydroquinate dehydratase-2
MSATIGILNGPNLNLLGTREPHIYGSASLQDLLDELKLHFKELRLLHVQSNHEGVLIDTLQEWDKEVEGIVFNPAAYTHTSIAMADTIAAISSPVVEVHLSNVEEREPFRKISYLRPYCAHTIYGKGFKGYHEAIQWLIER